MLKKKFMLLSFLSMLSIEIMASCGEEANKYFEVSTYSKPNNSRESEPRLVYYPGLHSGCKFMNGYSNSIDVELYYGVDPDLYITAKYYDFKYDKEYKDYDQIVKFQLKRYNLVWANNDGKVYDIKDIYSFDVKLGDFLTKDEYVYSTNNKIVDKLDVKDFIEESHIGDIELFYIAILSTYNDEDIKYTLVSRGFNNDVSNMDKGIFKPYSKSIKSYSMNIELGFEDDKMRLEYDYLDALYRHNKKIEDYYSNK